MPARLTHVDRGGSGNMVGGSLLAHREPLPPTALHLMGSVFTGSCPASASFRFYGELNDPLLTDQRDRTILKSLIVSASVKDMIESLGVPHPEVYLVLVNGDPADFSRVIRDGDRVAVYPSFESIDIRPLLHHRPRPLAESKFVVDVHLGRLAAYLRMLGVDVAYDNRSHASDLVRISSQANRILLTGGWPSLSRGCPAQAFAWAGGRQTGPESPDRLSLHTDWIRSDPKSSKIVHQGRPSKSHNVS
jgi:hypothetical protein